MTVKGDAKFKGKLTRGLKNDIKNFVKFNSSSQKSENLHKKIWKSTKELYLVTLKSDP